MASIGNYARPLKKVAKDSFIKKKFPIWELVAGVTAVTSTVGFAVGGISMMYEGVKYDGFFKSKKRKAQEAEAALAKTSASTPAERLANKTATEKIAKPSEAKEETIVPAVIVDPLAEKDLLTRVARPYLAPSYTMQRLNDSYRSVFTNKPSKLYRPTYVAPSTLSQPNQSNSAIGTNKNTKTLPAVVIDPFAEKDWLTQLAKGGSFNREEPYGLRGLFTNKPSNTYRPLYVPPSALNNSTNAVNQLSPSQYKPLPANFPQNAKIIQPAVNNPQQIAQHFNNTTSAPSILPNYPFRKSPAKTQYTPIHFNSGQSLASTKKAAGKKQKKEFEIKGVQNLVPVTEFGRIGLIFAKAGVALSGLTGILNGIAMKLPLMSVGESFVLGSSPAIEKNYGLGLFHVGLAGIFAGRALELDATKQLNTSTLKNKKGFFNKVGYVFKNIGNNLKAIWDSDKVLMRNIGNLFSKEKAKKAKAFFAHEVFNKKSRKILIHEVVNEKGKSFVKTAMKSSPYLMHFASTILALGGLTLTVGSFIKNNLTQRVGFAGCVGGGMLDNLSLTKLGLDKISVGGSQRLPGTLMTIAGPGIFMGQPFMDKKAGRGLMWTATGVLFSVFAAERLPKFFKLLKRQMAKGDFKDKMWQEATKIVREFEIDPTSTFKNLKPEERRKQIRLFNDIMNSGYDGDLEHFNNKATITLKEKLKKLGHADTQIEETFTELMKKAYDDNFKAYEKFNGLHGSGFDEKMALLKKVNPELAEGLEFIFKTRNNKTFETNSKQVLDAIKQPFEKHGIEIKNTIGQDVDDKFIDELKKELAETNEKQFDRETLAKMRESA